MKRALFFDIDGTLAVPGKPPGKAVVQAIREARSKGYPAFLSTGRTEGNIPAKIKKIGFDGGIYNAGGRVVVDGKELFQKALAQSSVGRITAVLERINAWYTYECAFSSYHSAVSESCMRQITQYGYGNSEIQRIMLARTQEKSSMRHYRGEPVFKINCFCKSQEEIRFVRSELGEGYTVVTFENLLPDFPLVAADIMAKDIHKGNGLRLICQYIGAAPQDCIAFGDSMNDAEMLQAAGTAVVMGNSGSQVQTYADMICDRCENDGVAKALKQLGVIEQL